MINNADNGKGQAVTKKAFNWQWDEWTVILIPQVPGSNPTDEKNRYLQWVEKGGREGRD